MILCHFFQIFYAKPSARMPKFVQKLQFCQNYTIWLRKKKSTFGGVGGEVLSICGSFWDQINTIYCWNGRFFHKIWA